MYSGLVPSPPNHLRNARAMNSGPLSERMCAGTPRQSIASASVSITSSELSRRPTLIARLSRVYSSIRVSILSARPSWVTALTKS